MEISLKYKYLRLFLAVMLITAGLAHLFFRKEFTEAIPSIIPFKEEVNILVAITEIVLGALFFSAFKTAAYKSTFLLFTVYIWVHINFIQMGSCIPSICIPTWIAWLRLIVIHPLLLFAVFYLIKNDRNSAHI